MAPLLDILGVTIIAILGIFLGKISSNLRRPYWILGYLIALFLIVLLAIPRFFHPLCFVQPFSWVIAGRVKFVVLCFAVTMGLTTPLRRLPYSHERLLVCLLMVIIVAWFSIGPFLTPALVKGHLANLNTRVDSEGICFQTTDFTCGPAAAVTALRKLGLPAEEGQIAILSYSSPVSGTFPHCLYEALQKRYNDDGLRCQYRYFHSIDQLKNAGIILAVVKEGFLSDHCVAVLDVSDNTVTVADPVLGKSSISFEKFAEVWRFSGITLKRKSSQKI